jgi:hypothetical protein
MATPESIPTPALQGETMDFGILAAADHIVFPKRIHSMYPGGISRQ